MPEPRYRIIDRIDSGGMAEVFVGEATSIEGFSKRVAIKRVLPNLATNDKFVRMFLDEARISLALNHANIVQVFDIGDADDTYFIVMEYVEGTNLRALLAEQAKRGIRIGIAEAVFIAAQVCTGLAYAHELVAADGRRLDLVHRDVSPPNILLSLQGEVKLTDFGLAKARSQIDTTDPGFVKGKYGYLSPEAAYGERIDHKTDLFAVGIVLWEMLAGRPLFEAETEGKILSMVRRANIPDLAELNPAVVPELDSIVRHALMRDRNARYESASQMAGELTGFLFDHGLRVGNFDIAALVERAQGSEFNRDGAADELLVENIIQSEVERLVSEDLSIATSTEKGAIEDPSTWFADDGDSGEMRKVSRELHGIRVGPTVTEVSTGIPVHRLQEAIAAENDQWEMREAEAPPLKSSPAPGPFTDEPSGVSHDVPIDVIEELAGLDLDAEDELDLEDLVPEDGEIDLGHEIGMLELEVSDEDASEAASASAQMEEVVSAPLRVSLAEVDAVDLGADEPHTEWSTEAATAIEPADAAIDSLSKSTAATLVAIALVVLILAVATILLF